MQKHRTVLRLKLHGCIMLVALTHIAPIDKRRLRVFTVGRDPDDVSGRRTGLGLTIRRSGMSFVAQRLAAFSAAIIFVAAAGTSALAQKMYDTGATDTEIKIGNIMPYSGPASAYGVIGKTEAAYFKKINDAGGINGRKINFISYDDGYSPPKTVEQARKLVESDEVLFIFNSLGTPPN